MTLFEGARAIGAQIDAYNTSRLHRGIGATPDQMRRRCQIEPERLDPAFVARALMRRRKEVIIQHNGIEFMNVFYFAPQLIGHVGEIAEIGWLEQHPEYIEVFLPGKRSGETEWLCRATPASTASKAYAGQVEHARQRSMATLEQVRQAAARIASQAREQRHAKAAPVDELPADHPAARAGRARRTAASEQTAADRFAELAQQGVFRHAEAE
jgi:uncharacterized membrane protein